MTITNTPTADLIAAAALLEAVARDSETAVDFEVPIRCGQAATRLHSVLGTPIPAPPLVGDDLAAIRTAVAAAITKLSSALAAPQTDAAHDSVLDALVQARRAAAAIDPGQR